MLTAISIEGGPVSAQGVDTSKQQIRAKQSQIRRDAALIEKLQSLPDADPAIIDELRSRITRLEAELEGADARR